jgi:predicted nuclease with RNAse H fold
LKALGVDVAVRKGLDLVLLDEQRRVVAVESRVFPDQLAAAVRALRPDVIAIDSPPRWAPQGGRLTERALRGLNLQLYATPMEDKRSLKGFHDWMLVGISAFEAVAADYPLFDGTNARGQAMEVFPHASAVVLAGHTRPRDVDKTPWRRSILERSGVSGTLVSPDQVDAALAALTGLRALEGNHCWFGLPEEGVIVLPCKAEELPKRFLPPDAAPARPPRGLSCISCLSLNPTGSRYCNQCGAKLVV